MQREVSVQGIRPVDQEGSLVVKGRLSEPGTVLGLLQLLLGLPELGQVEGGDLLSLLDLLLVGLDLGLQLASQVAHGHLVLLVLVVLELKLLDLALSLLVTLQVVAGASLHVAQFDLQLPDARLELGHGGLASLHGGLVGIGQTVLHVSHGGLKGPLVLGLDSNVVLFSTELISKASSIDHGLLGLLLRALGLVEHVVDLGLQGVDGALNPALVGGGTRVDVVHLVDGHASLGQLSLEMLPKHVTFVLDTSGSMSGEKITQLQDAMVTILSNLNEYDHFSILEFDSDVTHWQPLAEQEFPRVTRPIYPASQFYIEQAIDYAVGLSATGWTNINDALLKAVEVARKAKYELKSSTLAMIIFLTDGEATVGETNGNNITENVKTSNNISVPIYSLAFGNGADFELVKTISEENGAFARKIFEASDATIQLENFYAEISSPLLSNVPFHYVGENLQTAENVLPGSTFNSGSEFVSVVKLSDDQKLPESISVKGQGSITRREE